MSNTFELDSNPHTRLNILTGEWVLVSPHRTKRPWQGKVEDVSPDNRPEYDPKCYLCPGNDRADGDVNPDYTESFVFKNDFSALLEDTPLANFNEDDLLVANNQKGLCKVISFSPKHNLTLPEMALSDIENVISLWQKEFNNLAENEWIKYIQIFENKGEIMGCSNPHPHGQIWAQSDIPMEIIKETERQKSHYAVHRKSLLSSYLELELKKQDRIVYENDHFVVLVPFWAVWPYETIVISKRHVTSIKFFTDHEKKSLADAIKILTVKYDNLFETAFPYSAGMHQSPVNHGDHPEWHWHMHFYPPLLRSATVKKFMVGYEMLANPQRDITPEFAANRLRELPSVHYKNK
ncbi:UDP-glucose--hexose-1-phosphate uridylyltransferase [Pedobacter chinensis]|uniref:Galactose-1-phosphate uridylyltransferase n=1 Tax=Pedobacter chinensis TaxID=2282421 RepID=A0A369Q3V7_9SPHI|nr:UDP-glucose--hexose-1-phosphate uridylyltransferase [Pedobacter chinensis]RDC58155.1 UDP-glucose--hexose-1-phosphate uridylyltransferase [Pedobacter chinensis]